MDTTKPEPLRIPTDDGIDLTADAYGTPGGPTVLFLHGTGQSRAAWSASATTLAAEGWYAVTVDLRGHGGSGWSPGGDYSTDRLTADVATVVDAVGRPAALVGSSLGGRSLLVAAGEATTPLATCIVLIETAARLDDSGAARIGTFLRDHLDGFADLDEVADAIARYRGTERRPTDEARLLQVVRRRDDGRYHWHWDARLIVRDGEVVQHRSDAEHARTEAAARRIVVPALLLRGERSDLVTPAAAQHLQGLIPHCELGEIPGMGHMIAGDRDDRLRHDVLAFLRRHRPAVVTA